MKNMPKVNNRPMGENSPNLVTLNGPTVNATIRDCFKKSYSEAQKQFKSVPFRRMSES
jgi:hypothetical protein